MKKTILLCMLTFLFSMTVGLTSCECKKKGEAPKETVTQVTELVPETVISTDRQQLFNEIGGDYIWYETTALYADRFDAEDATGKVVFVKNTFQQVKTETDEKGREVYDVWCYIFKTDLTERAEYALHTFMVENDPLTDTQICLTFKAAYDRMMQANIPKPTNRTCVLRIPVGPYVCNAQYIFGDNNWAVFVDAVTGDVSTRNPAFHKPEEEPVLRKPLGEWP